MNWKSITFDWNQVRAFLVSAEEGSFSAASRALDITQPTLSRQVAALEETLGVSLFERGARHLSLTHAGLELLEHVRAMGDAANRISLTASGQSQQIEGHVCISATDIMSVLYMPEIAHRIHQEQPGISIEILASDSLSDLQRREADIAVRHTRPTQPDLIAKLLRESTAHLYAAPSFLETHGTPKTCEDLSRLPFIGYDQKGRMLGYLNSQGLELKQESFKVASQNGLVCAQLAQKGLGIAVLMEEIADATPGLQRLDTDFPPIPIPIWLVTHRELHTSRRIRLVFDILADYLSKP